MAMGPVRHVLVAVDQFPQSTSALARGAELARTHDAGMTVVHVAGELDEQSSEQLDATGRRSVQTHGLALARERVEGALRTLDLDGIALDVRVEKGSPSSRVVEIANDLGVDLMVLRAHQRRSFREKVVGSTADRIIRSTPSSVLVVKGPVERPYQNLLVAVDLSEVSEATALLSAEVCPDARLHLVHVTHVSIQFEEALLRAGTSRAEVLEFKRSLKARARERLRALALRFEGRRPRPRTRVIRGDPARSLVRVTRNPRVDLIAVGPYEHGAIRLALLGSVTQRLLREASCDVLISRPPPVSGP